MEVRASAPSVVHHIDAFERGARWRDSARAASHPVEPRFRDPAPRTTPADDPGRILMITGAGTGAKFYPRVYGRLLKAGSIVTLNVHYTTNGQAAKDRTRIAFKFAQHMPPEPIRFISFANGAFVIPPGAASHRVDAELSFVEDTKLWSLAPHAHYRGKSYE
jgi:hypothetical protein